MHATTIVTVRKGGQVVIAGDGQVSLGQTVMKGNARKVRRIGKDGKVIAGFAGATADAFTLMERLEAKLEQYPLNRASVYSPPTVQPIQTYGGNQVRCVGVGIYANCRW